MKHSEIMSVSESTKFPSKVSYYIKFLLVCSNKPGSKSIVYRLSLDCTLRFNIYPSIYA